MRVKVNSELCQGHNRCYALAPDLFDVDDFGRKTPTTLANTRLASGIGPRSLRIPTRKAPRKRGSGILLIIHPSFRLRGRGTR